MNGKQNVFLKFSYYEGLMPSFKISTVKGLKSAGITLGGLVLTALGGLFVDSETTNKVVHDIPWAAVIVLPALQAAGTALINYAKQVNKSNG